MLLEFPEFRNCTIRSHANERGEVLRTAADGVGDIEISVAHGLITLEGHVIRPVAPAQGVPRSGA